MKFKSGNIHQSKNFWLEFQGQVQTSSRPSLKWKGRDLEEL